MKFPRWFSFFATLLALCSCPESAHAIGGSSTVAVPSLSVAGRTFTSLNTSGTTAGSIVVLSTQARIAGGGASRYGTLRRGSATAGFQVPSGLTLRVWALQVGPVFVYNSAGGCGYGDTDVTTTAASPPTNSVTPWPGVYGTTNVMTTPLIYSMNWTVPASKYIFCDSGGATFDGVITLWGTLE